MSEVKPTWQRPVLLAEAGATEDGKLRSAIRWALVTIDTQQAEIERLTRERDECRRLLRAVLTAAEPWEGLTVYQVNLDREWIEAAKAVGGA